MSLQECLRLLEATFPFGEESEVLAACQIPMLAGMTAFHVLLFEKVIHSIIVFPLVDLKFQATDTAPQLRGPAENAPSTSQGLSLPAPLTQSDAPLDLEQQWQDIMAIMELQVCILYMFFINLWNYSWLL